LNAYSHINPSNLFGELLTLGFRKEMHYSHGQK
jgi:hypothetical protein